MFKADLVLVGVGLIKTTEELTAFRSAVKSDVQAVPSVTTDLPSGVTRTGGSLTINRERVALDLTPARSVIRRDYPIQDDLTRLAQIASLAITNTDLADQNPRAFGYNL